MANNDGLIPGIAPFPPPKEPPRSFERQIVPCEQLLNMGISGIVKSVLSGDCLILTSVKNPNVEKQVNLAWVQVPLLRRDNEEAFAFASREFLRERLVGKQVIFESMYKAPGIDKDFGIISSQDGTEYPLESIKAGWAKVRDDAGHNNDIESVTSKIEEYKKLDGQARDAKLGMHTIPGTCEGSMFCL
jgi:staphylococcal nuclease domain-containing protein 1